MKFGVREICDVVFKAQDTMRLGGHTFKKGQPVLYIDTAKTSTLEGSGTTVYATGGRGNARLMSWDGERALTFTVEDALLSPIGMAILSGAGLFKSATAKTKETHVHATARALVDGKTITLNSLKENETIDANAPVFISVTENDGSITGECIVLGPHAGQEEGTGTVGAKTITLNDNTYNGKNVFVDFYIVKDAATVSEIQIDAKSFGGSFYVEANTLFRKENGMDVPAELIFPNVRIQSNFTFNMSSTGDPSTFSFVMDAFPGYTFFNKAKKVICAIQLLEDEVTSTDEEVCVMGHPAGKMEVSEDDSYPAGDEESSL